MSYADKCFYFDFDNRMVELEDTRKSYSFKTFERVSLRKRYGADNTNEDLLSIECWPYEGEDGTYGMFTELLFTRDAAMLLATKLTRAVAEMDAALYRAGDLGTLDLVQTVVDLEHPDKMEKVKKLRRKCPSALSKDPKANLETDLNNFAEAMSGIECAKRLEKQSGEE